MIRIRLINEGRVVKQITSRLHEGVVLEQIKKYKDPYDTIQIVEGELSEGAKDMLHHVAKKIVPAALAAGMALGGASNAQAQGGANPNYPGLNHSVGQHMADIFSPNYKEKMRQRDHQRSTERQVWNAEQDEIRKQRVAGARAAAGGGNQPVIYDQSRLSQDGKSYIIYGIDNKVRRIPVAGTEYMHGDSQRLPHYITSGGNVLYVRHPHAVTESTELKKQKRAYNQAAKDANADQVGAGKKIDTMKNSLRQKDIDNKKDLEEASKDSAPKMGSKEKKLAQGALKGAKDMSAMLGLVRDKDGVLRAPKSKKKDVSEGYTVTRGIDRERYTERPGLEGPFSTRSGKVVYYDPKEGKYYDPETDFYIGHEDYAKMDEDAPALVKGAAGLALGGIAAAGAPAIVAILGPLLGIPMAAYGAYSAAKLGMQGVEKLWDMASEKLGGDDKVTQYTNAKLATLPPEQAQAGAAVVKKIGESKQGVVEGVAESLPLNDALKVLRQYGAENFKTTTNELHFYKNGKAFSVPLTFNDDATRSVPLSSLNSATRGLKGQGVAEDATVGTIPASGTVGTSGGTGRTQFAPTGKTTNAKFNKNGQIELDTEQEDDGSVNLDADAVKQLQQAGVQIKEGEDSPVASAIARRIMTQRLDLLKDYGPVLVTQAIDEVADFVGDVEEIGSSDVSGWVKHVEQMLRDNPPAAFGEGLSEGGWDSGDLSSWTQIYKTSYPEKIKAIARDGGIGVRPTNNDVAGAERILLQYWQEQGETLTRAHVEKAKEQIKADVAKAQGLTEGSDTLEGILSKYSADYAKFKAGGDIDENQDFFDALYAHYSESGEMPYGVQKARDGDPYEWITQRLDQESGVDPVVEADGDEATPGDQASADQNIIMQIRKASDYEKPTRIELADGTESVIAPNIARQLLDKFDKMKPDSKELLQNTLNTEEGFKEIIAYFGGGVREQAATRVGNIMQAAMAEAGYGRYDRRDAYQRDYDSSVAGMGKRQSYAYQQDGGANDEGWDQPERSYQAPEYTYYIRFKDSGKVYKQKGVPKSFANKKAANAYALAMMKNNPALSGNILLSVDSEDKPTA